MCIRDSKRKHRKSTYRSIRQISRRISDGRSSPARCVGLSCCLHGRPVSSCLHCSRLAHELAESIVVPLYRCTVVPLYRCTVIVRCVACLLYTSDAADDLLCVDLGGRRIIKKK